MNKKKIAIGVVDIALLVSLIIAIALSNIFLEQAVLRYAAMAVFAVLLVSLAVYETRSLLRLRAYTSAQWQSAAPRAASGLVLLGDRGQLVKSWTLNAFTGIVIGKSSDEMDVDIDLEGTEYHPFIDNQHATLNFAGGSWYIADAGSQNGTALQRYGQTSRLELTPGEPTPLEPGDTIYLAQDTVLAVE